MKLQIMSDLHLEHSPFFLDVNKHSKDTTLILAGDICPVKRTITFLTFIEECCDVFHQVLFVPGNHDFYGNDYNDTLLILNDFEKVYKNFVVLYNDSFVSTKEKIVFLGTTLWTDYNNGAPEAICMAGSKITDHRIITSKGFQFTPFDAIEENNIGRKFLKDELQDFSGQKIVVISHHLPDMACVQKQYRTGTYATQVLNYAYANTGLSDMILDNDIALWIHGHTHSSNDFMLGNTRIVCNPRGYTDLENPKFDSNLVIEI